MSADMSDTDRDRMRVLAGRFHAEVNECRRMAESVNDPSVRAEWLRLAEEWIKLAQSGAR